VQKFLERDPYRTIPYYYQCMNLPEILGEVLRSLRQERRWKQYEVAARAGLTKAKLSALERGLAEPNLELVLRVLRGLEVSWMEFAEKMDRASVQTWPVRETPGGVWK
jgi:transcriptional regulator with XRE-family HTH domain